MTLKEFLSAFTDKNLIDKTHDIVVQFSKLSTPSPAMEGSIITTRTGQAPIGATYSLRPDGENLFMTIFNKEYEVKANGWGELNLLFESKIVFEFKNQKP